MNRNASLFVGMTDRGWGSVGPKRWGVQRVLWTGEVPMEIEKMERAKDGFMLTFTRELEADAARLERYTMKSYTYSYHPDYGSDEMEAQELAITGVQVLQGRRTLWLGVAGLRSGPMGYVHELHIDGLRSAPDPVTGESHPLLHDRAYYTVVKALP